jgi:hypothetical protein
MGVLALLITRFHELAEGNLWFSMTKLEIFIKKEMKEKQMKG